jgi:hypothetical protein
MALTVRPCWPIARWIMTIPRFWVRSNDFPA